MFEKKITKLDFRRHFHSNSLPMSHGGGDISHGGGDQGSQKRAKKGQVYRFPSLFAGVTFLINLGPRIPKPLL